MDLPVGRTFAWPSHVRSVWKRKILFLNLSTVLRGVRSAVVPPRAARFRYAQTTIRKTFKISFRSKCARTVARERVYFARKQICLGIVSVSPSLSRHARAG